MGDKNPSGVRHGHHEATDFKALNQYAQWLGRIADDMFLYILKDGIHVHDFRASLPKPECNQIWFDGRVILNLKHRPSISEGFQVLHLGFDTPLGHKPILSVTLCQDIFDSFIEKFVKHYALVLVDKKKNGEQVYQLTHYVHEKEKYWFPAFGVEFFGEEGFKTVIDFQIGSNYKNPYQFVILEEAVKVYKNLKLAPPRPLEELLRVRPKKNTQDSFNPEEIVSPFSFFIDIEPDETIIKNRRYFPPDF